MFKYRVDYDINEFRSVISEYLKNKYILHLFIIAKEHNGSNISGNNRNMVRLLDGCSLGEEDMITYTGKMFNFQNPDFDIKDIAWSLAHQCRFNGHTKHFYSVAQHCIYCALVCEQHPYDALMHDAEEAYIGDITIPVKDFLGSVYQELRLPLLDKLKERFNYDPHLAEVKEVDARMLATEKEQLLPHNAEWKLNAEPYNLAIIEHSPQDAYNWFLHLYETLG